MKPFIGTPTIIVLANWRFPCALTVWKFIVHTILVCLTQFQEALCNSHFYHTYLSFMYPHRKTIRHIYRIIEIIKHIMLTWRDEEDDDKKCWDFLHLVYLIILYRPICMFEWRWLQIRRLYNIFIERD